jgi:hypothetical protein
MKRKKQLSNFGTTHPSWIRFGTVKDQPMKKMVLGTIRKKKVASRTPFTNMSVGIGVDLGFNTKTPEVEEGVVARLRCLQP